jgi:hypothetical protein
MPNLLHPAHAPPYSDGVVASVSPTAYENYFKEQMKTCCYDKVKRLFYEKYNCYGFYQRSLAIGGLSGFPTPDNEPIFHYTYDYDQYKSMHWGLDWIVPQIEPRLHAEHLAKIEKVEGWTDRWGWHF